MDDNEEKSPDAPPVNYPKKYWWVVIVVIPVLLGLLKIVPDLIHKSKEGSFSNQPTGDHNVAVDGSGNILNSDLSTKSYVVNLPAIEKEYAAAKGEPLRDEALRKEIESAIALLNSGKSAESAAAFEAINREISLPSLQSNLGVAYQRAGDAKSATAAFAKALDQDANYAVAHHNLGLVNADRGELTGAREHFARAGNLGESKALGRAVEESLQNHDRESEPNNDAVHANVLPLEKTVAGTIAENDTDFFLIKTPAKYRDIVQVRIEKTDRHGMLQATVTYLNSEKVNLGNLTAGARGANHTVTFAVEPETNYFLQIGGAWNSTGAYEMKVTPLKKYDAFEPNEDLFHAPVIEVGKEIEANIMDPGDADYYRFKTKPQGVNLKVHIETKSPGLQPAIRVFDSNKAGITGTSAANTSANLDTSFAVQPNATYFLHVCGNFSSTGDYALTLTQE